MTAGVDGAVGLDAVNGVMSKVDAVTVAHILPAGCTHLADESQCEQGMRDRKACAQRSLDFAFDDAQYGRDAGNVTGVDITRAEALDSLSLLYAPLFLRQPSGLFPALPLFFLVRRNPGLERVQLLAFGDGDVDDVEEGDIAPELLL